MGRLWALVLACGVAACGLDMSGLGPPSPGGGPTVPLDGGADGASSGAPSPGDDGGGAGASSPAESGPPAACPVPSGWSVVAYEPDRNPCPAGYGASHDEVAGATAASGACGCTCSVTAQPTCEKGSLSTQWAATAIGTGGGSCTVPGVPLAVNGPGCTGMGSAQLAQGFSAEALQASGGACSAQLAANPTQVTKNGVRMCDVPPAQVDAPCTGSPPAGFSTCITAPGDVACPGGPFGKRSVIADDEVLVCASCDPCQVNASCQNAQVTFYSDLQCRQQVAVLAASGSCVATGGGANQSVSAFVYSAQLQASCLSASSGAPAFNPVQPHTLCCL